MDESRVGEQLLIFRTFIKILIAFHMLGFSLFLLMLSLSLTTLWSFSPAAASRAVGPRLTSRSAPSRCRSLVGGRQGYHASSATLQATEEEVDPGAVEGTDKRIVKYPHPSLRAENGLCTDEEVRLPTQRP